MKEQPHYTNLLTEEFFQKHYVQERMSYPKIREMLLLQGHNIHVGTLYQYAKKLGFGRSKSEAKDEMNRIYVISSGRHVMSVIKSSAVVFRVSVRA